MKRSIVLGGLMLAGAVAVVAAGGGQAQAPQVIEVQKVKDNYYVLLSSKPGDAASFSGGNVGVFITGSGVVLVDTKLAAWGGTLLDTIKGITNRPVTTIINTHSHGDHTGNDDKFGASVEIVAHENTKANMEKMDAFKGANARFLPKRTFKDKLSIGSGADRIDLYYFGPGHTNGDSFVVFPALRVLQTGDIFAWKDAPRIDRASGGSGVQYPQTLAKAAAALKDVDIVVPGHSPLMKPADLQEYQRYTSDLLAAVRAARTAGRSVDEAAASINLTARYPGYASERVKVAVQDIYDELAAGAAR